MLDIGRRVLSAQPFSVLLGAELRELADGHAELRVPLRPDLLQQDGLVHDGLICYAADNAITFAAGSVLGTGVLTSGSRIDYLRPARPVDDRPGDRRAHRPVACRLPLRRFRVRPRRGTAVRHHTGDVVKSGTEA